VKFSSTLLLLGNNTGIEVPEDVFAALGSVLGAMAAETRARRIAKIIDGLQS
jgi:hypothetical protein